MKTYMVTGGAGFIGSEFIRRRCSARDFKKLFIVDKLTYAANLERISNELKIGNVELIEADVSNTDLYQSALKETDFIVHFAAESHVDRSIKDGIPFIQSNIVGSYSLLEAARLNFVKKILMVSTDEVYGSIEKGASDESFILYPSSIY